MRINADVLYSKLLADLSVEIQTDLPGWSVDSTPRQSACYCLRDSLLKKFLEEDKPSKFACDAALKKFLAVNDRCANWSLLLDFSADEEIINSVKQELYNFWYIDGVSPLVSDVRHVYLEGRPGPGASISARGEDFYTKMFDSTLSATEGLPELWERCVSMGGLTFEAEASRSFTHGLDVVASSRYSFVNKTTTVARGICTEPSINMWFQLGLGKILEDRLKTYFGISLKTQPDRNRELARAGSINGHVVTIDLESASDSLGIGMLKYMLPKSWFAWLELFRSPRTILPTGSELELNMVSTMGNGFTFPLQTVLFSAVVKGVAARLGIRLNSGNFGVFGDDIICPKTIVRSVLRVLNQLGFVVNTDKTFVEGPFRESCGADYYNGFNVRGVYLKRLRTLQDLFVAINTLIRWSAKTGVSLFETQSYLRSFLRRPVFHYAVPFDESDDSGIHTPLSYVPKPKRTKAGSVFYICRVPTQYAFYILGGIVWTYREQVRRNYNPAGLYISLLFGGIRGYRVLLRQRVSRYTTRRRLTPRWDYLPPRPLEGLHGSQGFRRIVDAWHRDMFCLGWDSEV